MSWRGSGRCFALEASAVEGMRAYQLFAWRTALWLVMPNRPGTGGYVTLPRMKVEHASRRPLLFLSTGNDNRVNLLTLPFFLRGAPDSHSAGGLHAGLRDWKGGGARPLAAGAFALWRGLPFQVALCAAMRLDEALLWKGGTLHSAWKGKLSPDQCHSHRALLVSSVVGKALHSTIRGCCAQPMKMAATPLQVGGLPAYPVTFASHCVRLFQSHCKGRSHFLLFLDLKEAFYRIFRALLRSDAPSEEEIAYFFRQLELPPSVFDQFRRTVCQENSLAAAGSSQWLRAVLGEILSDSWFKMQWQEDVTKTSLGVRPGDALADTLFFFVFSQVLRATRQRLTAAGLTYDLPWSRDMHRCVVDWNGAAGARVCLSDAVWMDDACLMGSVDRAADAVKGLADTAGILIDECLRRGLQPSLEANKTGGSEDQVGASLVSFSEAQAADLLAAAGRLGRQDGIVQVTCL